MLMDVRLNEKSILLGIEAAGDVLRELLERSAPEVCGILAHRYRVHIRHKIVAVELIGSHAPVLYRAEIVSKVKIT